MNSNRLRIHRRGLTLVEMLVTLGIIAIIAMVFNMVLVGSREFVTNTQARTRATSTAEAVLRTVRQDVQKCTTQGFLAIRLIDPGNDNAGLQLAFSQAGKFRSVLAGGTGVTSDGAIVAYSMGRNSHSGATSGLLLRRQLLLAGIPSSSSPPADVDKDLFETDSDADYTPTLGTLQFTEANTLMNKAWQFLNSVPTDVKVPAGNDLDDVDKLWQVLSPGVEIVQIRYARPNGAWVDAQTEIESLPASDPQWLFWSHHDPTNWPRALHIVFKIHSGQLPADVADANALHEVVVPLGA
jgi:prepilin-type N-terminal cleavage/methylation domain-containing protein